MKEIICALTTLILCYTATSQNLVISYDVMAKKIPAALMDAWPELANKEIKYKCSLSINNGLSKYSLDSVLVLKNGPNTGEEICYFKYIYKSYDEDLWLEHTGKFREGYGLRKSISTMTSSPRYNYDWTISEEKRIVDNIEVVKAKSPRGDIAWFAPSIPYPDGPQNGIFNLPGVVLIYETEHYIWQASKVSFEQVDIVIPRLEMVANVLAIELSIDELKALGSDKAIRINQETPLNIWLRFQSPK